MEENGAESTDTQSTIIENIEQSAMPMMPLPIQPHGTHVNGPNNLTVLFRDLSERWMLNKNIAVTGSNIDETKGADTITIDPLACNIVRTQPPNTCRVLQRKLELKMERARRNYNLQHKDEVRMPLTSNLIPISRLPIPENVERDLLVDYNSDNSDEPEELPFFPARLRHDKKIAELTDTFSIQEIIIDSDINSDDSESQSLELLPPLIKTNILDRLTNCFNCMCVS